MPRKALGAAGAAHLYLAGRPGELEAALKAAGVQDFIYVGCDVLGVLRRLTPARTRPWRSWSASCLHRSRR